MTEKTKTSSIKSTVIDGEYKSTMEVDNFGVISMKFEKIDEVKKDNVYTDYMEAVEYNKDLCSTIAMEECSELIQAISKGKRGKLNKDNMSEEIADVIICIDWISRIYEIEESNVIEWLKKKHNRIVERLNKGEFK